MTRFSKMGSASITGGLSRIHETRERILDLCRFDPHRFVACGICGGFQQDDDSTRTGCDGCESKGYVDLADMPDGCVRCGGLAYIGANSEQLCDTCNGLGRVPASKGQSIPVEFLAITSNETFRPEDYLERGDYLPDLCSDPEQRAKLRKNGLFGELNQSPPPSDERREEIIADLRDIDVEVLP